MPKLVHKKRTFSGDVLSIRRAALGYSISQLAVKLGCSRTAVHKWEIGKFQPSPKWVLKLSEVLKTKPEYFNIAKVSDGN